MGIEPPQPNQIHPFNVRNLSFILSLIMFCTSTLAFLIFRAKTLVECGICLYTSLSGLTLLVLISIGIWQEPNIFKLIEMREQFIEMSKHGHFWSFFQSKNHFFSLYSFLPLLNCVIGFKSKWVSNSAYNEVIEKIENMSKLIHFALIKVSLVSSLAIPVVVTLINYLMLHKGAESFPDVQLM